MLGLTEMETWTQNHRQFIGNSTKIWILPNPDYYKVSVAFRIEHKQRHRYQQNLRASQADTHILAHGPTSTFSSLHACHVWAHVNWRKVLKRWAVSVTRSRSDVDCSISCLVSNDSDCRRLLVSSLTDPEFRTHHSHPHKRKAGLKRTALQLLPLSTVLKVEPRALHTADKCSQETRAKSWSPNWRHRRIQSPGQVE